MVDTFFLTATRWIGYFLAAYLICVVSMYLMMTLSAMLRIRQDKLYGQKLDLLSNTATRSPGVSILVPAFNEEAGIVQSISSLLNLNYKNFEIIVINDGSEDSTLSSVIDTFMMQPREEIAREQLATRRVRQVYQSQRYPNLRLIDKQNGGKADALNAGINYSSCDYVCTVDGDSILEKNALKKAMRPFAVEGEKVAAVGGTVELINGNPVVDGVTRKKIEFSPNPIVAMQSIEYYRSFLIGRVALSQFNHMLICSGAFTVFEKDVLIKNGGLSRDTIGEDMEAVVKIQKYIKTNKLEKKIIHVPDAICYTEAPETLKVLRRQRRRWHQGLLESLWTHKDVGFNPKFGSLGWVSFPFFLFAEAFIPLVELLGYLYLFVAFLEGQIMLEFAIFLSAFSIMYSAAVNSISVIFNAWLQNKYPAVSEIGYLIGLSLAEPFWYKPLTLFWRIEGFQRFFKKSSDWGRMERTGFDTQAEVAS